MTTRTRLKHMRTISGARPPQAATAPAHTGQLQDFLDRSKAYRSLPAVEHTPDFNLERITPAPHATGTEWYYIRDGRQRIGLIQTLLKEIEMFDFMPSVENKGRKYEIPQIYHWANIYGARIQMYGTQKLPPVKSFQLTIKKSRGDSLELVVRNRHLRNLKGISTYQLTWDPHLGYVWNCTSRYSMPKPEQIEFNNLFAGGVAESRNDRKKWQKTVRALRNGRISFVHHNPINTPCDNIHSRGFVGFVTEKSMNPFVELTESSNPVYIETCDMWYDQHIVMEPPRLKGADGLYHAQASYRFLSLPARIAREIEAVAIPCATAGRKKKLGFLLNSRNTFETFIPANAIYNGGVWKDAVHSRESAHSGSYSLKVAGNGCGNVVSVAPIGGGPGVVCDSKKRYRLTAWVKTKLSEGTAYVRVDDAVWNWNDVRATRESKKLSGRSGWTRLAVEFQPAPHDPFLVVRLCVDGRGAAWFDDVMLKEVKGRQASI